MSKKKRTVKSYPTWKQIEFADITLTRGEFKVTEKLLNAEVIQACHNNSGDKSSWLRLFVKGKHSDYK